jgi:hypothetical protein
MPLHHPPGTGQPTSATQQDHSSRKLPRIASIGLSNSDGDDQNWVLELKLNGNVIDSAAGRLRGDLSGGVLINDSPGTEKVTLVANCTITGDGTLSLRGAGYQIYGSNISVRALKVGAVLTV